MDEGVGDDGLAAGEVGPGGEVCDNPDLCSQLLTLLVSRLISMTYWMRVMATMGLVERFVTTFTCAPNF
jgi:hypothetical protein